MISVAISGAQIIDGAARRSSSEWQSIGYSYVVISLYIWVYFGSDNSFVFKREGVLLKYNFCTLHKLSTHWKAPHKSLLRQKLVVRLKKKNTWVRNKISIYSCSHFMLSDGQLTPRDQPTRGCTYLMNMVFASWPDHELVARDLTIQVSIAKHGPHYRYALHRALYTPTLIQQ